MHMNESLTSTSRRFHREARQRTKAKNYVFNIYAINGQVMVRKNTNSEHIIIESKEDRGKIN